MFVRKRRSMYFSLINTTILGGITLTMIFPFVYLVAISLSSPTAVLSGSVSFYPKEFTTLAYQQVMNQDKFWNGYVNTFMYTSLGTFLSVILTIMAAYPLSKKKLPGRDLVMKFIVFTMFFSGGLIPFYLVIKSLHMLDTIWAIIVPGAVNAYNVLIMRTYFMSIPESLEEAAEIDGLNPVQTLLQIVLPNAKPIIATVALFNAVWYWNDWFNALILLNNDKLYPVTMYLRNIMMGLNMAGRDGSSVSGGSLMSSVSLSLQAASTVLIVLPIIFIYPFAQKYFVKGVMLGSIKG